MLSTPSATQTVPYRVAEFATSHAGLSKLFAAAVVSPDFRAKLLAEPETALARGYHGQSFALTPEERSLLISIRADSLSDLARQVNRALR